jgi:hypothetical protein
MREQQTEIRELTGAELNGVSGGLSPVGVLIGAGLAAGTLALAGWLAQESAPDFPRW